MHDSPTLNPDPHKIGKETDRSARLGRRQARQRLRLPVDHAHVLCQRALDGGAAHRGRQEQWNRIAATGCNLDPPHSAFEVGHG